MSDGLKQSDIQKCGICGHGVMECGSPAFYKVSIQPFCVDIAAVKRQHGLEMMVGNPAIAYIVSPQEDLAKPLSNNKTMWICQNCALEDSPLALLTEGD